VENERWLADLLEACNSALGRLREPQIDASPLLVADLEEYRHYLQTRLAGPRGSPMPPPADDPRSNGTVLP
jgi:hypothetical protein